MTKRDQQRLYNAALRLVYAVKFGDPKTMVKLSADDDLYIDKRTKELDRVLKEIKKPC